MLPIILLLFIFIPIIEIALFIQIGGILGAGTTILIIILTAFIGAYLVRIQGIQTLLTAQQRLQAGEVPTLQIIEGIMLFIAGVLLITPGFMTDALSIAVLLPMPRQMIAKYLIDNVSMSPHSFGRNFNAHQSRSSQEDHTFEGEYEKKDNKTSNRLK